MVWFFDFWFFDWVFLRGRQGEGWSNVFSLISVCSVLGGREEGNFEDVVYACFGMELDVWKSPSLSQQSFN